MRPADAPWSVRPQRSYLGGRLSAAARRQALLAGGVVGEFDGLVVSLALLPRFDLNLAIAERDPSDPHAALERAARFCREHGTELAVDLESGQSPALARAAEDIGLQPDIRRPAMALALGGFSPPPTPDGVWVRKAVTEADVQALAAVEAEGSGFSRDVAERLFPAAALFEPGLRPYVAILDGQPVASALLHLDQEAAGIYWVVTVPSARRRGIGAALVGRMLVEAAPDAEFAWLQSSRQGRPLYERLGFRVSSEWTVWRENCPRSRAAVASPGPRRRSGQR